MLTLFRNLQLFALVDFLGGNTILSGDIRASLMSFRNQPAILGRRIRFSLPTTSSTRVGSRGS